jgi:lantibiotic modifying enzyme
MSFTAAEIESIVGATRPTSPGESEAQLRSMLAALGQIEFRAGRARPLRKLCAAGVDYGWNQLIRETKAELLAQTKAKARASLRRYLQWRLEWITRPSLELEWTSFALAMDSLGLATGAEQSLKERMFLRERPSHRLSGLFKKFPVLARLWFLAICQWRRYVAEVLGCVATDRTAISHSFFSKSPLGQISDMRLGLSDPHHGGRSVILVEFERGRVIYKPRSGTSESAWFELLRWMNRKGFRPELRAAQVLQRKSYYWMEYIEPQSCRSRAAVRRFHERLGGMIAAAFLLKAVDCHRQNVIAFGEYPVLVDVDALWHVSSLTKTQSPADVLYRTGFFPNPRRRSLQSRSSVLGSGNTGHHLPRIEGRPVAASDYTEAIADGFSAGWKTLIGTSARRGAFQKSLRQIRARPRRWIYLATEKYAAMQKASVSPAALQSEAAREALMKRLTSRSSVSPSVSQAEMKALRQLDVPYFVKTTAEAMPADSRTVPPEITEAIRNALLATRLDAGKEA